MNRHLWYLDYFSGAPKTYRRPRTCEECRRHPKGGCLLPVRKQRKVRWFKHLEDKPMLWTSVWWSEFLKGKK